MRDDPLDGYAFATPLDVGAGDLDVQGHLNNVAVYRLFQELRVGYVQQRLAPGRLDVYDDVVVVTADAHVSYLSQGLPGEAYDGAASIVARTDKAYCYDEVIVARGDRRVIARARVVELWVARSTGRVTSLSDAWLALLAATERRPVEVGDLPLPRITWSGPL